LHITGITFLKYVIISGRANARYSVARDAAGQRRGIILPGGEDEVAKTGKLLCISR